MVSIVDWGDGLVPVPERAGSCLFFTVMYCTATCSARPPTYRRGDCRESRSSGGYDGDVVAAAAVPG